MSVFKRANRPIGKAQALLGRWRIWVEELEHWPLDANEYRGALEARDLLGEALVLAGDDELWDLADEVDYRFKAITEEEPSSPFIRDSPQGWWWSRLPVAEEYRRYLAEDF